MNAITGLSVVNLVMNNVTCPKPTSSLSKRWYKGAQNSTGMSLCQHAHLVQDAIIFGSLVPNPPGRASCECVCVCVCVCVCEACVRGSSLMVVYTHLIESCRTAIVTVVPNQCMFFAGPRQLIVYSNSGKLSLACLVAISLTVQMSSHTRFA